MGLAKNLLAKAAAVVAPKPTDVRSYIRTNEGKRLAAYKDTAGVWTIGIGHTGHDVHEGLVITDERCEQLYNNDCLTARIACVRLLGGFREGSLDEVRRAACHDLAFNLGETKLRGFHQTLDAIRRSDWETASKQLLASEYAKELPKRAQRNALMLLKGEWV